MVPVNLSSFLTSDHVHQETVSSGWPGFRVPIRHLQTKRFGVPWSSRFKIRGYGRSLIAMHVLLTSYWACGFLGRQKPRSLPETRALSPAAMWTWHPSQSPRSGYPRASSPVPPREGPSVARPELTDHQDCPSTDNGRPGSPERHAALGEGRSLWKEEAPSAMVPEKGQGLGLS